MKSPGTGFVVLTFPIPGFVSAVGFAASRFPGDGVQLTPCSALGGVDLTLFLFGKLLVGNVFFH